MISRPNNPGPREAHAWARASTLLALFLFLSGCGSVGLKPNSAAAGKVVVLARSLQDAPYRYGGRTPKGFDCSGFVQYVFQQAVGLRLPRTSALQYQAGRPVPVGEEAPSDLIFFSITGAGPTHVGIYLGDGQFIHAPNRNGSVRIVNANDAYWRQHFIGLRRVLR